MVVKIDRKTGLVQWPYARWGPGAVPAVEELVATERLWPVCGGAPLTGDDEECVVLLE